MTTGKQNTIIGSYDGNQGGLDIRTASNNIVLSDGAGNPRGYYKGSAISGFLVLGMVTGPILSITLQLVLHPMA